MEKHNMGSYDDALVAANALQKALDVTDAECRIHIVRVNGKKRHGYRVSVVRLSDGVTSTNFISD